MGIDGQGSGGDVPVMGSADAARAGGDDAFDLAWAPPLAAELRGRLLAEIAPIALAVDLRRWRAAVAGRAREERLLADILRAGRVGTAPTAPVSTGAELDLRLRNLPPSPSGVDRDWVAVHLAEARERLAAEPDDAIAAWRWVRLRLLAGALRTHGPATPALDLLEAANTPDAAAPAPGEAAQVVVAAAVDHVAGELSPDEVAIAIRRLRAAAPPDLRKALPEPRPAEWSGYRSTIESVRMRLLGPLLRSIDWGGAHREDRDWLQWAEAAPLLPPEPALRRPPKPATRRPPKPAAASQPVTLRASEPAARPEPVATHDALPLPLRRRLLAAALVLPAVAAAAVLTLIQAPDVGRLDSTRLVAQDASAAAGAQQDRLTAAGLEVTDDWSSVTVQLSQPGRGDILEVKLASLQGEVVAAAGLDGHWALGAAPVGASPGEVDVRGDGATVVITLAHSLRPAGLTVTHFALRSLGTGTPAVRPPPGTASGDQLPAAGRPPITPVGPPARGLDWADPAFALVAIGGAAVGIRLGLHAAAAGAALLVTSIAAARVLAIPVAAGLGRLTGDDRSATAISATVIIALVAAGLTAGAARLADRDPPALMLARLRVAAASLPRRAALPAEAVLGAAMAVAAAALVALLCVDVGPLGIAALRLRASTTGSAAVDAARWLFGA